VSREVKPPQKRAYPGLYEKIIPVAISLVAVFVLLLIVVSLFVLLRYFI
jgi:hypothetical protein